MKIILSYIRKKNRLLYKKGKIRDKLKPLTKFLDITEKNNYFQSEFESEAVPGHNLVEFVDRCIYLRNEVDRILFNYFGNRQVYFNVNSLLVPGICIALKHENKLIERLVTKLLFDFCYISQKYHMEKQRGTDKIMKERQRCIDILMFNNFLVNENGEFKTLNLNYDATQVIKSFL